MFPKVIATVPLLSTRSGPTTTDSNVASIFDNSRTYLLGGSANPAFAFGVGISPALHNKEYWYHYPATTTTTTVMEAIDTMETLELTTGFHSRKKFHIRSGSYS